MTERIGIHIDRNALRAVLVDGVHVLGAWKAERDGTARLASQLDEMFEAFPRSRWYRPRVTVALGPRSSQSKLLTGLPRLHDRREVDRLVRENASRFFVGDTANRLVAATPFHDAVLAETYDRSVVEETGAAARRARISRLEFISAASALALIVGNGSTHVEDDGLRVSLRCVDGRIADSRRSSSAQRDASAAPLFPAELKDMDRDFVIAYGAATHTARPGIPSFQALGNRDAVTPRWRAAVAIAGIGGALFFLLTAPVLSSRRTATSASAELNAMAAQYKTAIETQRRLDDASNTLATVGRFQSVGHRASAVLENLTRVLPRHAALLAFAMDSAGGSLVAVSERVTDVLSSLETVTVIASPQLAGPITRERHADKDLDRATIRFSWNLAR